MYDGHQEEIGPLADIPGATLLVKTRDGKAANVAVPGQTQIIALPVAAGEYVELSTESGRKIKCSPRAKVMMAGGGFAYAAESAGAVVETCDGPEKLNGPETEGKTDDLVSIRIYTVHSVAVNGFWFLTD
jgi:hypothetical protein